MYIHGPRAACGLLHQYNYEALLRSCSFLSLMLYSLSVSLSLSLPSLPSLSRSSCAQSHRFTRERRGRLGPGSYDPRFPPDKHDFSSSVVSRYSYSVYTCTLYVADHSLRGRTCTSTFCRLCIKQTKLLEYYYILILI